MHLVLPHPSSEQDKVLTKALINLARFLELSGKELSEIIGISESGVTRIHQGKKFISPKSKEGELALLLLRVYRSLNSLVGNHPHQAKEWLTSENLYFQKKPMEALKTVTGLVSVVEYLDAMRGKL